MPPEVEELEEQEIVNEEVEEVDESVEEEEEEPIAQPSSQAQALWDLLNNQATAKSTLNTIARNLGLTVSEGKTEEGQKAIKDVIKLALGDELAFLGDKLGPLGDAIENIINDRISKAEVKINEVHQAREAERYSAVIDNTIKSLDKETKGEFSSLLPTINKLMEEMPIGKQTPDQYLRRLYRTAKNEASENVKKPTPEAMEKSRREGRRTSTQPQLNTERVKDGSSKNPTYRESIMAAVSGRTLNKG